MYREKKIINVCDSCAAYSLYLYHFIHWLCICTRNFKIHTIFFISITKLHLPNTLTYHIIMPCLSNCLFNTFIDPLLTFCSLRPSNNCLELPVVFFLCSPNIWYAKWFHIPFWKFCVVLSSRIDYKLASIAWCIRITLVYFRWDTMKRDMASEVAKTDRKKQQENTVERWFRQANTKHCQTLFDFPTRLIRINSMQNKWKAREYQ